ncbi:FRG domain-containing protein [Pseudomonas proteolytica]|uniref:FRG domain-containing protein n=1 Tax=Pseudomonas proteolytica TaxID=219574 RepID=UPI001475DDDA|nr:FRG domain-containing protein [Pseudomonas proteolytica]NMZ42266.1 FRG domain-containing protein [Pseudomonas proteolytica]
MSELIFKKEVATSDEFLNILFYRKLPEKDIQLEDYVFRGQHDANFLLTPSALRDGSLENMRKKMAIYIDSAPDLKDNPYIQASVEYQLIRDFYRYSDMQGLYIPESKLLRNLHYKKAEYNTMASWKSGDIWLPDDMLNAAALAQHYGVPTRLLDWSYDPLTAAYFATAPMLDGENKGFKKDGDLCIWGLSTQAIAFLSEAFRLVQESQSPELLEDFPLKLITPPYHGNPNLSAQQGLFSHWSTKLSGIDSIMSAKPPSKKIALNLENLIRSHFTKIKTKESKNMLIKITLPNRESEKVAKHLRTLGYGPSKIYPGYAGANMEICERPYFTRTRRS